MRVVVGNLRQPAAIIKTENIREAWYKTWSSVSEMGFDYGVYPFINADRSAVEIVATENAAGWVKHHIANQYVKYDPVARVVFNKKQIIWHLVDQKDKISRKIESERSEHGMKYGISIPILNRFSDLVSVMALSSKGNQQHFDSIVNIPFFTEKIYGIHIKTVSHSLSKLSGLSFNLCYALVLSHYTNNVNVISKKTGFLVDDLNKLYSHLYLYHNNIDFFCLDIQQTTVNSVKDLNKFFKESGSLKYKFSNKQLECIGLIKKGLTAKQAARVLKISPRTFEWYTGELKQKLECNNQRELIFKLSNLNMR